MRKTKVMKRVLCVLLMLTMMNVLLINVEAEQVNNMIDTYNATSGPGWSFESGTNTLTLNGLNLDTGSSNAFNTGATKIVLNGDNTVTTTGALGFNSPVEISGTGSLTITTSGSFNGLTVNSGTLNMTTSGWGVSGSLTVKGGDVTITSTGSYGADMVTVNSGKLTMNTSGAGVNNSLTVNGGHVEITSTGSVAFNSLNISGGYAKFTAPTGIAWNGVTANGTFTYNITRKNGENLSGNQEEFENLTSVWENGPANWAYAEFNYNVTPPEAEKYDVTIGTITNGQVEADKTTGLKENDIVTLTVSPATGYELNTLTVKGAGDAEVSLTQDSTDSTKYTFTMPASDVNVSAAFKVKLSQLPTPNATFTADDYDTGMLSGVYEMMYSIDGGITWKGPMGTLGVEIPYGVDPEYGIKVYEPGDNVNTSDSQVQTITVTRANKPTGVTSSDCTTAANNNGKIQNVDSTMEYRKENGFWANVGNASTVEGLAPGNYEVRVKARGTTLASESVMVTVAAFVPNKYNVTFDYGYTQTGENETYKVLVPVEDGKTVTEPTAPTREGYDFKGWYGEDNKLYEFTAPVTEDITLTAEWETKICKINVLPLELEDDVKVEGVSSVTSVEWGENVTTIVSLTGEDAAKYQISRIDVYNRNDELVFPWVELYGWTYSAGTLYIPGDIVKDDIYIYIQTGVRTFNVTFNYNDGATNNKFDTVEYGKTVTEPTAPTREGYDFKGWYGEDNKLYDFTAPATGDITLTAKWQAKQYNATWMADDEQFVQTTVTYDSKVTLPTTNPTKTGHTFTGWFTKKEGGTQVTADTVYQTAGNSTYYAQWTIGNFNATFNANGGAWTNGDTVQTVENVTFGDAITAPADPTRTGFTFTGWSPEVGTMDAEGKTFIAQWKANTYTITWMDDEGNVLYTEDLDYGTTPAFNPEKSNKELKKDCHTLSWTPTIEAVTGDATYTAVWTLSHTGGTEVRGAKKPTCTEKGYTGDTYCLGCGDKLEEGEVIPALKPAAPVVKPSWKCWKEHHFHNWGNGCDKEKCAHKYTDVVTKPDCCQKGYTTHTCKKCGYSYKDSYTNALGHAWDKGRVTKKATCTKAGEKTYTCKNCGETKTKVICALDHHYVRGTCTGCGKAEKAIKPCKPCKPRSWPSCRKWLC